MSAALHPIELRCEYQTHPLGIESRQPRLGWQLDVGDARGVMQRAYQVLVAGSPEALAADRGDRWDSGQVESDASIQIVYGGAALESRARCWWKVRVWTDSGAEPSPWSEPAAWEMGLLDPAAWSDARWIGSPLVGAPRTGSPAPYLRREFALDAPVASARLYVTALGVYEFYFNGSRVGDEVLRPGWTEYGKRVQYDVYDVTALLRAGANAAGAILGDGWYCGHVGPSNRQGYGERPLLRAFLAVTLADGTARTILATGDGWKTASGPIIESDLLQGESFDNRLRFTGGDGSAEAWSTPGFDDAGWAAVVPAGEQPTGKLVASRGAPVRRTQELPEVKRWKAPPSSWGMDGWLIDLGQNMVGRMRLTVRAKRGTTLRLRHVEILDKDGKPYTENLRGARCTDYYTCSGEGDETWEPRFTFHGFRYVEITTRDGAFELPPEGLRGIVLHSDTPATGEFECSDPLVNQLQRNIQWGQRGNFLEVPTDCPQRDERLGWTGDAQVFVRTAAFNMDVATFFTKWQDDIDDAQAANGNIPPTVPRVLGEMAGGAAWEDAALICPWTMYLCYGDTRLLAEHYDSFQRFQTYLEKTSEKGVRGIEGKQALHDFDDPAKGKEVPHSGFGDWLALDGSGKVDGGTPKELIGTAFFAYSTGLLAKIAAVLGKTEDAARYGQRFEEIRAAFQREFVTPGGRLLGGTQTAYVLGLYFDLLPPDARPLAVKALLRDITGRGMHLATGFVGTPYLPHVLTAGGELGTAYNLLFQKTWPSWLYAVTQGATTIWERWDGWTHDRGFQTPEMNSYNHYAYGAIGEWLYSNVAGIDLDPAAPGYKHLVVHPRPGGGLEYAKASLRSPHGLIESGWRIADGEFRLDLTVPANTTATVTLPAADPASAREGGAALDKMSGLLEPPHAADGTTVLKIGSGRYAFSVPCQ